MKTKALEPKPNNPKIDAYSKALEYGCSATHFVFESKGGWTVRKPGSNSSKSFLNKNEAVNYAKSQRSDVVVFDRKSKSIEIKPKTDK